jgi:DNA-binding CsgD family transcriptional regulator
MDPVPDDQFLKRRNQIDILRRYSASLDNDDSALLQLVFEKGISLRQIARVTGQSPSTVSRRFRRLVRPLKAGRRPSMPVRPVRLSRMDARIIQDYVLRGHPLKTIARKHKISLYRVRKTLRGFRAIGPYAHRMKNKTSLKHKEGVCHVQPACKTKA